MTNKFLGNRKIDGNNYNRIIKINTGNSIAWKHYRNSNENDDTIFHFLERITLKKITMDVSIIQEVRRKFETNCRNLI